MVVEVEVGVAAHLAVLVEQQHRDIRIALTRRTGPAQTHDDGVDTVAEGGQPHVGTLGQLVHNPHPDRAGGTWPSRHPPATPCDPPRTPGAHGTLVPNRNSSGRT